MTTKTLMPIFGMNTVQADAELEVKGKAPFFYVRDAVNVDITPAGDVKLRDDMTKVTNTQFRCLWQSPLHHDVFGALNDQWVKINPVDWSYIELATIGAGKIWHELLNNQVIVSGDAGIFTYDGSSARLLTIDTPTQPLVDVIDGSLEAGTYGVAVSWLRGTQESGTSLMTSVTLASKGGLEVHVPYCSDPTVTAVRIYLTQTDGMELQLAETLAISNTSASYGLLPELGRPSQFRFKSPMPVGKYLKYWSGRILTTKANVLRFSDAMAYHLFDERHGFIQFGQRITFVQPVDAGIWVGQVDHVVFLAGNDVDQLVLQRKTARPPVPDSAILVDSDTVGAEHSQFGGMSALWLAENGYVIGTPSGSIIELHSNVMEGITGLSATSVVLDRRILTSVM